MNGFEIVIGRRAWFIVTEKVNKTDQLCSAILRKLLLPDNPDIRAELKYYMVRAELDYHDVPGNPYYLVHNKTMVCSYPVADEQLRVVVL